MPIHHSIWRVGDSPSRLPDIALTNEQLLEDMIVAAPEILSEQWMIIGRQEDTGFGGRIDLLPIAPDGTLILIELKRGRTPREVVAQVIDYATWLEGLDDADVDLIYGRFAPGRDLASDFQSRFRQPLDKDGINQKSSREPATDFKITTDDGSERPALDLLTSATYHREFITDPEKMEYFAPVDWLETVSLDEAVNETGLFGNTNTVCAPRTPKWRHTIERLKQAFLRHQGPASPRTTADD